VWARFVNLTFQGFGSHPCLPSATPLIVTNVPEYQTALMQPFHAVQKYVSC